MPSPYELKKLPLELNYGGLISLVGESNAKLAEYNGLLQGIVNSSVLLSPLMNQEAVLSSKIEGTQATYEEVLQHEAGQHLSEDKTKDIHEILNYRKAIILTSDYLRERPLRLSFIRQIHKILMENVRGEDKTPGEFRLIQNWIGPPGCKLENATYIPPSPLQLETFLKNWEDYLNYSDIDPLIQTAIVHAQFELIHPFLDGNGRIGRLLIPLYLYFKKTIAGPMFYLSTYLEQNREEYYMRLQGISKDQAWIEWISFFLRAIISQSINNISKVNQIKDLYQEMKEKIRKITKSQYCHKVVDSIFETPIFAKDLIIQKGIPTPTAQKIIKQLTDAKILLILQRGSGRKPTVYCNHALINIVK